MSDEEETRTVALLEAIAEARTLIEDLSRLADELKARQDQLGELLAPSETALRARTEYLDKVMREQLGRAEQRVVKLSEDVERIARSLSDQAVQMPMRLAEADQQREVARTRREPSPESARTAPGACISPARRSRSNRARSASIRS